MAQDVQIKLGDGSAPQDYTVPNATEIIPLAVNAVFDGAGAASDWVPAIVVISDGGVVVARVPCQTTVAAGASAECTFAPFLRTEKAAGALVRANGIYAGAAVSAGATGGTAFLPWDTLVAGDAVLQSLGTTPAVKKTGYYIVSIVAAGTFASTFAVGTTIQVQLDMNGSGGLVYSPHAVSGPVSAVFPQPIASVSGALWMNAGDTLDVLVSNGDANPQDVYLDQASVALLATA